MCIWTELFYINLFVWIFMVKKILELGFFGDAIINFIVFEKKGFLQTLFWIRFCYTSIFDFPAQLKYKHLPRSLWSSFEYADIFVYQQLVDLMLFVTACFQQPIYLRTSYSYQFTWRRPQTQALNQGPWWWLFKSENEGGQQQEKWFKIG